VLVDFHELDTVGRLSRLTDWVLIDSQMWVLTDSQELEGLRQRQGSSSCLVASQVCSRASLAVRRLLGSASSRERMKLLASLDIVDHLAACLDILGAMDPVQMSLFCMSMDPVWGNGVKPDKSMKATTPTLHKSHWLV